MSASKGCYKRPSYGKVGGKAELCAEHTKDGMVNVRLKRCSHVGCTKQPSYGIDGGRAEFCAEYARNRMMVNIREERRGHNG